jgi:ParB family transcriptional regulator, chromosome partitioning protein
METKGKGLNSLLSDSDDVLKEKVAAFGGVVLLALDELEVGPWQPRSIFEESLIQELADSIKLHGLIQPITVRKVQGAKYQIISGERRYRASKLAELEKVPAYIRFVDDEQSLQMALIENLQRENLNPVEVALSFRRMVEELNLSQEELALRVGKSRSAVANFMRVLNLPTEIQSGLILGVISMGQAKPLISMTDKAFQLEVYHKTLDHNLSSREIEAIVKNGSLFEAKASNLDIYKEDMRIEHMSWTSSARVAFDLHIKDLNKGNISIKFDSISDLEEIMSKLQA